MGKYVGDYYSIGVIKGDTRSLDYGSYRLWFYRNLEFGCQDPA